MEVMGLMLGEFVDDYTIRVADVFAMPQVRFLLLLLRCRWRNGRSERARERESKGEKKTSNSRH